MDKHEIMLRLFEAHMANPDNGLINKKCAHNDITAITELIICRCKPPEDIGNASKGKHLSVDDCQGEIKHCFFCGANVLDIGRDITTNKVRFQCNHKEGCFIQHYDIFSCDLLDKWNNRC